LPTLLPAINKVLNYDPSHVQSMFSLGCLYRALENFPEANYWLERAQRIAPITFTSFHRASVGAYLLPWRRLHGGPSDLFSNSCVDGR
jgi:hypothetical protein